MKRKFLSILLTLAMALTLLPSAAMAEEETSDGAELAELFTEAKAGAADSGDVTVTLEKDYDLTGYSWTSLTVDGYHGAGVVTVEGNNHKITGLNAPLFAGGFAGTSGIVVKNLTLTNVTINDSTSNQGIGAFINNVDSMPKIELDNCHLTNSAITSTGGACVGGLIGWTSGYNNPNDGPVDTYITVKNCSVENTEITAKGSVGGIIGHAGCNPATFHTFTDNTVTDCKLNSTDDGGWRVGVVVGTANVGEISIADTTESNNTLTQADKTAPKGQSDLYGRFVPGTTGKLVIDGVAVFNSDIVAAIGNTGYKTLPEAVAAAKDGDTVKLLKSCNGNGIKIETQAFNDKGLTVDFGGNTYTVGGVLVGSTGTGTNAFQLLKDNKVTFQNGEIVGVTEGTKPAEDTPGWHGAPAIMIQNYCDLTLKNMTVTGGDETVYTMSNNHGDVVIEDSTITAGKAKGYSSPAIAFDVCGYSIYTGVSVTVKGSSTINGDIEVSRSSNNAKDVKLVLESGTINGELKIDSSIKPGDATAITRTENVSLTAPSGYTWAEVGNTEVLVKENSVAVVNGVGYATLADALNAVKDGETITLLKNAELPNAEYYINKSVTINGSGKISCTVKAGEGTRAFVVENNGSLTLDGVELDIQGTKNTDTAKKNDGTGIDVQYGGSLILKNRAVLNLHDLERGTISSKPDGSQANPGQFVIDNSTFNSTNIDGNVANGGDWKVTNGSVDINTCGSYGLSVDSLTTEQSTVNVSGTGYSAIYGKKLQFNDGSNVLISGAGTKLPLQSQWSDARSPIQTDKNGGTIVVDSGAVVTVQNCENKEGKANNTIYLPKNTTYTNNGTVNATIITDTAPEGSCVVTLVSDGKTIGVQTVSKDFKFALPEAPAKNNYTFKGWSDGSATYKVGDEVVITKDTTFTAQWSYNGSSSGGGSSSSSRRYDVSAPSVKHGDVTVSPKSASKGDTVTITVKPDSGYELDTLTVKDASGSKIKVKDKGDGKFTFTMPASKVTVSAEFAEIETLDFADVSTDAYYYEAVKWAAKKGITGGTGDGTFNPNGSCTRAHIVTFLWRAAGSPEPKSTVSFADVPAGSYYAKAVAWAVENGITLGTGDGTFSPNATCTRAQSVTFLYRALGTAPTTVNGFTDVTADAFYADAVAWAVESGVTNGTSASTFSPNNGCTRAQIVTFLYRTMK